MQNANEDPKPLSYNRFFINSITLLGCSSSRQILYMDLFDINTTEITLIQILKKINTKILYNKSFAFSV